MTENNELQRAEQVSPNQMIQLAIEGNADLEKLEKLLGLQERYEANEARKVFASDFAVVQSDIGAVVKTKVNPQTHSKYAGLEDVLEMSKPVYTRHGFSIIFYEGNTEVAESIRVCADVLHKAGHKETYHFDVPLDGKGIKGNANMTKIHGKASSVSYGRRYLLCMIWNIPTQDDDGNASVKKPPQVRPPTDEEWEIIAEVCKAMPAPPGKRVDAKKVAAICYESKQAYPYDMSAVGVIAEWLAGMNRPELFIPDNRSQFEIDNDMPGDENSVPDTEAEETAAAKFGEENDQVELRYYCTKCDKEFPEFKIKGVCVNTDCLSRDIIDRQKS